VSRSFRARHSARRLLLLPGLVAVAAGFLVAPAHADTPQERAAALAVKVQQLQQQAEIATESYNAAEGQLGLVITQASLAKDRAAQAEAAVAAQTAESDARARALYMLGGAGPLYAQVFAGSTGALDLHANLVATRNILQNADDASHEAVATSDAAAAAAAEAQRLADQQGQLETKASTQLAAVQNALAAAQQALDTANADVRALVAAAQQGLVQSGNAAFTQRLTPAEQAALASAGPASSPAAATALAFAESVQGHPYRYAGTGPNTYDCSGLTGAAYAAAGINLPRTAAQQYFAGPHIAIANLAPGDLLFWGTDPREPSSIYHVAIYAGAGMMVSANHTGDVVRLQPVWWSQYYGASRPNAVDAAAVGGPRWGPGQAQ